MKELRLASLAVPFLCGLVFLAGEGTQGTQYEETEGGLITLYAFDDLQASFDFRSGLPGGRIEEGQVVLDEAQLVFHALKPGQLTFGFARDERVNVIEVGPLFVEPYPRARDRAPRYPVSIVHTIFRSGSELAYADAGGGALYLPEARAIFDPLPAEGLYHVEPRVGHTYVLRAKLRGTGGSEFLAAFEVVGLMPGHSVTLRWSPIH